MTSYSSVPALPGNRPPPPPGLAAEDVTLRQVIRRPVRIGLGVIVTFVVGSLAWSMLAPLAAGAVAPGIISPDGSRRTVQHLEGGIIQELKVRDGDEVSAGAPLVVLQSTQAAAAYDLLLEQARTLTAARARLQAEQAGSASILFPPELTSGEDPKLAEIMQGQRALFEMRRAALTAQKQVLNDRTRQYEEQIRALEARVSSAGQQLELIEEEVRGKEVLLRKALVTKPEILRLERTQAALIGERGQHLGAIAEIRQRIGELVTQRISLDAERAEEVSTELEKVRAQYADVSERLNASLDVLNRTVVTAPVSGKIVNLRFKSPGGVIRGGEPILEIVPTEEQLLIDARVAPSDIDVVTAGLTAAVHLTAFSSRGMPRVDGIVRSVSADRVVDEATGQTYYLARVEVPKEELAALDQEIVLVPGMPAEVLIVTGERTALAYMLEPFFAAFRRGFKET